ncbi:synaptic vesicle transporter [Coleophoma cylindrospora]|uniref:Synaptic vesicle transporter n=1 Tax=Coleophoma cylindrospora TaxID=1849047 RepID=A0A3D8Q754_9HELO|nr:synaptic vesicle transporter [Coleophoma cylindrospora]
MLSSDHSDLEKSSALPQFTSLSTTRCNSPAPEPGFLSAEPNLVDGHVSTREVDDDTDVDKHPLLKLPTWRKSVITFVASWMTFASTFSSAALFPAVPEIAADFGTSEEIINVTNAAVFLAMGTSTLIWGPLASIIGRRTAYIISGFMLFVSSIGMAVAPNLATFVAMRLLAAFEGTYFMVAGQTIIADLFIPTKRGTAVGFFMSGSVMGPALGPCLGGIITSYASWRILFWTQTAMVGIGFILSVFFVPSVKTPSSEVGESTKRPSMLTMENLAKFNPINTFKMLRYPNILLTDIACGFLAYPQYSLLIGPEYVINPRFHLNGSAVSGVFYFAPAVGFLTGSLIGGKFADITVKKWIKKRGMRLPQDRLNSGIYAFFIVVPVAYMIYGWVLEKEVGGLAVPVISIAFTGFGIMAAFNSLNTYCAEAIPAHRTEIMSTKYFIQYVFGATANATFLPLEKKIGIGLVSTIGAVLTILSGCIVILVAKRGLVMQRWVEKSRTKN